MNNTLFIQPQTLKKICDSPNIKILDATFFLPDSGLDAEEEYKKKHIPNSIFFDINKIADPKNPLPHMIPSKEIFSMMMQNLGINNQDKIIIYDNSPLLSSARAWFLFRYFGHKNILILSGGLKNWEKNGGVITNKKTIISKGDFINVIDINQIYGPVTYILKEITGSTIESLKVVIYVNNNIFLLANVTKYL